MLWHAFLILLLILCWLDQIIIMTPCTNSCKKTWQHVSMAIMAIMASSSLTPTFFQTSPSYQSKSWFHLSLRNNLQCHSYMATKSMFQGGQSKTIIMSIKFRNELTPLDQMIPANSALWVQAVGHHCSALRVGKVCCLRAMWVAKAKEKALFHSLKVTDNPTQTKQTTIML